MQNDLLYLMGPNDEFSDEDVVQDKPFENKNFHKFNKVTKPFDLILDSNEGFYSSRIGVNLFSADKSEYSIVFEIFWENSRVNQVSVTATSSVEVTSKVSTNIFKNNTRTIVHLSKFNDAAPNYLMFDTVVRFNGSYGNKLPIWVVVYGSKGYHNDVPVSAWDFLYRHTNNGIFFNIPIQVSHATSAQNPVTKHIFDDSIAALAANNFLKSTFYAEDSSVVDFTHLSSYKNNKVDGIFTLRIANSELTTTGLNKNNFIIFVSFNQNDSFIMLFAVHRGLLSVKTNDKERQLLHCLLS